MSHAPQPLSDRYQSKIKKAAEAAVTSIEAEAPKRGTRLFMYRVLAECHSVIRSRRAS